MRAKDFTLDCYYEISGTESWKISKHDAKIKNLRKF